MGFYPFFPLPPGGSAGGALAGSYPNPALAAGAVTAASLSQAAASPWLPGDNGLLAASGPLPAVSATQILSVSVLYVRKIYVRSAFTATNIWFLLSAAGLGTSSGSFAGLFSSAGTLLSGSADIGAALIGATGPVSVPLTTPQAVAASAGFVWAGIVADLATTQPTLRTDSGNAGSVANLDLAAAVLDAASNGTTMATFTPSGNVSAPPFWMGIN
jgi:trimeric autotransporter adhesin